MRDAEGRGKNHDDMVMVYVGTDPCTRTGWGSLTMDWIFHSQVSSTRTNWAVIRGVKSNRVDVDR